MSVTVENGSDKPLTFQPQLKLMRWSTAQEVEPLPGGEVVFEDLRFAPRSEGVMTLDLSGAYDVAALEKPLQDNHYYLLLTNQNFLFGQDWICSLFFSDTGEEPPAPVEPLLPDQALTAQAEALLRPFLENTALDPELRRQNAQDYWADCREVMEAAEGRVVSSVSPLLFLDKEDPTVIFDDAVPTGEQFTRLTFTSWTIWDSFGVPVGGLESERALTISGLVPHAQGQADGGAAVPLCWYMFYDRADTEDPAALALIRGRLLPFDELEGARVLRRPDSGAAFQHCRLLPKPRRAGGRLLLSLGAVNHLIGNRRGGPMSPPLFPTLLPPDGSHGPPGPVPVPPCGTAPGSVSTSPCPAAPRPP